jgi:hypothetical protein
MRNRTPNATNGVDLDMQQVQQNQR